MLISSEGRRAEGLRGAGSLALAAVAALLLSIALAGCTPEPPDQGSPTGPVEEEPSPSGTADPTTPEDEKPTPDDGTATGTPEDDEGTPDDEGDVGEEDESTSDPDVEATDDWQAPDDPTAEGPTATPALPEVNGEIGDAVALPTEMVVSLTSITTTTLTAQTPGEYTGPAIVVDVQITNDSDTAQPISSAVVSLDAEDGQMGVPTWASPYEPLQGEVPAGATIEGTYVFMMDPTDGRSVTVRVNYSAGDPVAVFTGTTS